MAKQLNVDLRFNADTSQARQQIQQLQQSLTQIAAAGSVGVGGEKITADMKKASAAAKELQMHLSKAMNPQTGTLDLNRLNNSLLGAKTNVQALSTSLLQIGPSGTTAFTQLATSIAAAGRPTVVLNGKLMQLWTVMKNTMRWQLTSSMLHGFIGGISNAYRYAQDLNKSLNNIRIVTGYSAEHMEEFAVQANKAAKALSTTTNEYAKASLIYYQQGLSAEEVSKRADVTIKLANVSRQSAETVSDQMTAVWNNFYDGSKSLEYYADVMTALGAKTASSSAEIAGGLEKFAAIGDTIGLSYEYAAAALATITANTRQSEDVVGTALKTIFARIQGLKLGETLEDGTELNKYSEALKSVGIDIFDANKELKNMDTILNETAAKWETLTKAQQTALAQTVAGVRQYNQFIALMDNWNDGTNDSMVKNLETSYGATGTLQSQADTYAESWEAAKNRVKASAEAIYDALLDDKFFIGINNMFSGLLDGINGFINGIGGLKGVLLGAFALISSSLVSKIQPAINNTIANFQVLFQGAAKSAINLGNQMSTAIEQAQQNTGLKLSLSQNQELTNASQLIELKNKLSIANKNLSESERFLAESSLNIIQQEQEKAVALAQTIEKLKEQKTVMQQNMVSESNTDKMFEKMIAPNTKTYNQLEAQKNTALLSGDSEKVAQINSQLTLLNKNNEQIEFSANAAAKALTQAFVSMQNGETNLVKGNQLFGEYIANLTEFSNKNLSNDMTPQGINNALVVIKQYVNTLPKAITGTEEFKNIMTQLENSKSGTGLIKGLNQIKQKLIEVVGDTKLVEKMLKQLGQGSNVEGFKKTIDDLNNKEKELLNTTNQINNAIKNFNPTHKFTGAEKITAMGSSMTSLAMSVNMFKSAISAIGNEDMSWGEKLTTIMMSLGMTIPMVTTLFNNMYKMMGIGNAAEIANMQKLNFAILETQGLTTASIFQEGQKLVAKMSAEGATRAEIEAELEKQGIQLNGISLTQFEEATDLKALTTKGLVISATQSQAAVDKLQQAATNGNILAKAQLWALEKAGLVTMVTEKGVKKAKIVLDNTEIKSQFMLAMARAFANHPLLIALGLLAALIGVVALVVVGIKALVNAYNADAIALEQANAALAEQQKVLQETKAAHEELLSTLEKYEEAYKSLQTMTEGTEEWKNQVEELNKQVVDLITKYPKLAKYIQRDTNGVMSLNSAGVEELKKESDQKVQDAEIRTLQAQHRVNTAKQQNDITQMSRKGFTSEDYWSTIADSAQKGISTGVGRIGKLIGAFNGLAGGLGKAIYYDVASEEQAKGAINDLISSYKTGGEDFLALETTQLALDELAMVLGQDKEAILELVRSNQALNETNRLLIEQEVDQQFKDDKIYQNSKYQDVMRDKAADIKETEGQVTDEDIKAAKKSLGFSGGFLTGDNYSEYLEAVYGDDAKDYKVENAGGTHFTVKKFNKETQQYETVGDKNGVSNEEAIKIVAQKKANDRADKKIKEEVDTFEIEKQAQRLETKYEGFGISDESATQITSSILKGEKVNFAEINQSDLDKLYNYQGKDRQMNQFKRQVQEFENNGGVLNATNESFKEIYNMANQDFNVEQATGMTNKQAIQKENEILAAQEQIETIKGFYKELNDEDKKLFAETIDFKKAKTTELMQQELEKEKEKRAFSNLDSEAQKYDLDAESLKAQAKQIQKALKAQNGEMENSAEVAAEMAVKNQRLNKGVDKLTDNWKDWKKALTGTDKTTQDYADAVVAANEAISDILNLTEGSNIVPDDFWDNAENIDLMEQIGNGSEEAVRQLGQNLFTASVKSAEWSSDIADNMSNAFNIKDPEVAKSKFNEIKNNLINTVNEMQGTLNGLQTGDMLKPEDAQKFATSLNEYANATKMSVEDMQSMLNTLGLKADIKTESQPMDYDVPEYTTYTQVDKNADSEAAAQGLEGKGWSATKTYTVQTGSKKMKGAITVANIDMGDNPSAPAPQIQSIGTGTITPSVTTGGKNSGNSNSNSGNKAKKPTKAKTVEPTEEKEKDDEIERYKEITEVLDDLNNELDEIGKLKDDAWGPDKIAAMDDELNKLNDIVDAQETYINQIGKMGKDGKALGGKLLEDQKAVEALGGIFDENGRLTNYEELMGGLVDNWNTTQANLDVREQNYENSVAAVANTEYGEGQEQQQWAAEDANDAEKEAIDKARDEADKTYEDSKKAIEQYMETLNLSEEAQRQLDDYLRQIKQLNYEKLEYKIEFRVELNENDIADMEHQLERIGENNVYASAERIATIRESAVSYRNIADIQIAGIKEAEQLYAEQKITQTDYLARLKESKEALQEVEMSIRDGIAQIGDELENTFDLVDEKLDQQFTQFDQLIEVMDHYKNVVSLTQGEASYKEFNEILKASQQVLRDRIAADKSEVTMWENRRKDLQDQIATLPEGAAKQEAEEALSAIMEKEAEAKSQLMADIEQLGEYSREIFENAVEQAMKEFEEEMFGGSLNSVIESIDRMNSRQEELLTTTNKIYETNKLIRNVEKDIEATSNKRAKQALAEFQNKVKQKQQQNELTKFELDLLTAEYEMTKAQIALEEAQNAKDTVRLTRDAEGNYGYVYTANEDKVADAEQALDDATNKYYNTGLEGAQKYQDQIYQHTQEWEEQIKETYLDQTLSEEAKNKKIKEINDTYNTLIAQDKKLYYIAIGAMQEQSYNNQVDYDLKGIESAEKWFTECDGYLNDLKLAQNEYDIATGEVKQHTEENFGKMSDAIDKTTKKSEGLRDEITKSGGLADVFDNVLKKSIDNATTSWLNQIAALKEVIRLTNEAMKTNQDAQLKEGFKDDYAGEISKRLANGADYNDYDIQQLLQYRWEKMGGVDNTDYAELIAGGGTPEQIALWEVLRRFKIDNTDWSTSGNNDMRAIKMDQDFAALIMEYLTKNPSYARWSDKTVQGYLAARQAKIDEGNYNAEDIMSNEELKEYIANQMGKKPEELLTGGYTGAWGPEGKLAVLHEKELVLNKQDTENLLASTMILREISQMLDRNALLASLGMADFEALKVNEAADQVLQQDVTIHAEFPNVTDHNEIELAIDNLINAASQHAYRV